MVLFGEIAHVNIVALIAMKSNQAHDSGSTSYLGKARWVETCGAWPDGSHHDIVETFLIKFASNLTFTRATVSTGMLG